MRLRRAVCGATACGALVCGALVASVVAAPACAGAQGFPFSQRGASLQSVANTEIEVHYGRPVARGRLLFADSGLVKYGQVWHPGADSASRIRFSRDVLVEGRAVPAGEYTIWLIPRGSAPWTLILSKAAHVFHTPYPGVELDQLRVELTPETLSHMESMAIYFASVVRDDAIMRIHWGTTALSVRIKAPFRPPPTP